MTLSKAWRQKQKKTALYFKFIVFDLLIYFRDMELETSLKQSGDETSQCLRFIVTRRGYNVESKASYDASHLVFHHFHSTMIVLHV